MIKNDELSSRLLLGTCSPPDCQFLGKHLRFSYLFSRFSSKKGPFWPGNQPEPARAHNGTSLVDSTMNLRHLTIICNKIPSIFTCISHKMGTIKPKTLYRAKFGLGLSCQPLRPARFGRFGPKALSDIIQGGFESKTRNTDKNWGL